MTACRYLLWDAPNIDMTLAQLLGDRPRAAERPDMRALLRWFVHRKRSDERSEAVVFVNVPAEPSAGLKGWIAFLTSIGYRVYAKPKESYASDVDEAMVAYIESVTATAGEIIVASNDARRFTDPLKSVAQAGVGATAIGFAELAGELTTSDEIEFVDLEEIPGLLKVELHRIRLDELPNEGAWFEPRISLDEVAVERAANDEGADSA